jgi:hypothetical protein
VFQRVEKRLISRVILPGPGPVVNPQGALAHRRHKGFTPPPIPGQ